MKFLTPKFPTCAHGSVILEAQNLEQHAWKSLHLGTDCTFYKGLCPLSTIAFSIALFAE